MPDDFRDLKDRMLDHSEALRGFFLTVGMTLIQCQAFEDRVRQFKLLVFEYQPSMTGVELEKRLADSRKRDTLGPLLKDLAKRAAIEPKTQALFDEFLTERNWFIHHLEYQHGLTPFDPATLTPLVARMKDIQDRSLHIQKEIAEMTSDWMVKQGHASQEIINKETRDRLDAAIKPPSQ